MIIACSYHLVIVEISSFCSFLTYFQLYVYILHIYAVYSMMFLKSFKDKMQIWSLLSWSSMFMCFLMCHLIDFERQQFRCRDFWIIVPWVIKLIWLLWTTF